jgi:Na+/melibiose symporter-like transporter
MASGGVALLAAAALAERRAVEPVIPLELFRDRTVSLATAAGLCVGLAMFGATIFLAQYFQIARGSSPTMSGAQSMPMILGLAAASLVTGRLVSKTGRWKRYLLGGTVTATVGFGLLGTMDASTDFVFVAVYMTLVGIGLGMTIQNLVLSVQNTVAPRDLGAATATVSFFRSLGGAIGVAALGAVLAHRVADLTATGLARAGLSAPAVAGADSDIPDVALLPHPVARIVEHAYGQGVGHIFLVATPLMALSVVLVALIKEAPLRRHSGTELMEQLERGGAAGEVSGGVVEHVASANR